MTTSDRMVGAIERSRRHWKRLPTEGFTLPPRSAEKMFSVAISREAEAHGNEIARAVGEQLGWAIYDGELVESIAKESGLRAELLESVEERQSSWLAGCLEAFAKGKHVSSTTYAHHLAEVLASLSAHGHCIIVGRGAVAIMPPDRTFRVRVVADIADRIQRCRARLDCSEKEARRAVEKTERERVEFVKKHFHKDTTDPHLYDLVISSSRFTTEQCARLIVAALRDLETAARS